jgi:hypothetical protein
MVKNKPVEILFISANSSSGQDIPSIEAYKEIAKAIETKGEKYFELKHEHDVSIYELGKFLSEIYHPQIVHFFCHGKNDFLFFQDKVGESGEAKRFPFAQMFCNLNNSAKKDELERIRCVVLIACHSARIAKEVSKYVESVIGVKGEITPEDGITFAKEFYSKLNAGKSVQEAFDWAKTQVEMPGGKSGLIIYSESEEIFFLKRSRKDALEQESFSINNHNDYFLKIIANHDNAKFFVLDNFAVRSPLELLKENQQDDVLNLMADLPKIPSVNEQIKYSKEHKYVDKYPGSWAERELELIGFDILKRLYNLNGPFKDMYDAGSANSGQYRAMGALRESSQESNLPFTYFGQDFNTDWKMNFDKEIKKGTFIGYPLPYVNSTIKFSLVSCTHTLHYLVKQPIAIYTSLFSFNRLLVEDGYCYITVPEKESQPGMLELLERAATDSGFVIVESGRKRLIHKLKEEPHNITTFSYLVLKKQKEVDEDTWKCLIAVSWYRQKYRTTNIRFLGKYDVNKELDVKWSIRLLEMDLKRILYERNNDLRLFRSAIDIVNKNWNRTCESFKLCTDEISKSIDKIHHMMVEKPNSKLEHECAIYFYHLIAFYVSYFEGANLEKIVRDIYPSFNQVMKSSEDIRVHLDNLSIEQIGRLLKHLFQLCNCEKINLRKAFDEHIETLQREQ